MKKLLLATTALIALAGGSAVAADMPVKAYTPPPPPCCTGWAGFYLGIHGGYGWKDNDFSEFVGTNFPSLTQVFVGGIDSKGWVFGGHFGYNWQYGPWVVGPEIDFSATGIKGDSSPAVVTSPGVVETHRRSDDVKWLGTARARLGYTPFESLLIYGTAGPAWERFDRTNTNITAIVGPPLITITSSTVSPNDRFGWVAGVGGEAKLFGSNWIGRIEYLHYEFRTSETVNSQTITGFAGTNFSERAANQKIDVVRAGISYKF